MGRDDTGPIIGGMTRRMSTPAFVGRSGELDWMLASADVAEAGRASLAIVGGEAGVGKTRLVAEVVARLRARGWLVLGGGSVALGDDGLPFGPIVEALRVLVREVDPARIAEAAGPGLPELARLVPELSRVGGDGQAPAPQAEWVQVRIFEGVLRLLANLSETEPVLLVVEDLHWADRSTRDLLAFLARNARAERLFVVATFRTDELHRRHPLTTWLAEAERQPRVQRTDLARFGHDDLVDLLGQLTGVAGEPIAATLVDLIARRSDGNAFFAEELVASIDESGRWRHQLPDTLRDVLLVRLAARSDAAGRLLEIAAVAGREVSHELLADVCGLSEAELTAALREAVDAQILLVGSSGPADCYRFRHALLQEAAYDQLLPSERRHIHETYAHALEARPAIGGAAEASRLVELAHHWSAAHDPTRALHAAVEAGDTSRTVYAYAEAGRQYERAIELWDAVPADDRPTDRDLGDLYDAASATATLVGDGSRAVSLAQHAIELVDAAPGRDRERRARARERLGFAAWLAGDTATSIRLLEEAVDLLSDTPPSIVQGRVLAGLAGNLMLAGRSAESVPFAERAIACARTIGDLAIESRAMNVLGVDRAALGNIGASIDLLRRAMAIGSPADDPLNDKSVYTNLGTVLEMGGFVEEALDVSLAGAEHIRRYGSELSFLIFLEVNAAAMLIELARYPEAAELLDRNVSRVMPGVSTIHLNSTLAHLEIRTGKLAAARHHLVIAEAEASRIADAQFVIDLHTFATEIESWEDDPVAALAVAIEGLDRLADIDDAVILGQLAIPAVRAGADLAVRSRAGRDPAGAEAAVAAVRDVIDRYRASTARLTEIDQLAEHEIGWRMDLCAAELARGAGDDHPTRWDAIRPVVAARPAPFLEAYVLWRAADAFAALGDHVGAAERLRAAHTIARRIGAPLLMVRIEGLGRRLRVDLVTSTDDDVPLVTGAPKAEETAEAPAIVADPFGLTVREREVLALVAEGYTNRRIASELFISDSTAGVHVSNILGKLGVVSRTEAATVAVRLGLDRPTHA